MAITEVHMSYDQDPNLDYVTTAGMDTAPVVCLRHWHKDDYVTIKTRGPYHTQEDAARAGKKWAAELGVEFR